MGKKQVMVAYENTRRAAKAAKVAKATKEEASRFVVHYVLNGNLRTKGPFGARSDANSEADKLRSTGHSQVWVASSTTDLEEPSPALEEAKRRGGRPLPEVVIRSKQDIPWHQLSWGDWFVTVGPKKYETRTVRGPDTYSIVGVDAVILEGDAVLDGDRIYSTRRFDMVNGKHMDDLIMEARNYLDNMIMYGLMVYDVAGTPRPTAHETSVTLEEGRRGQYSGFVPPDPTGEYAQMQRMMAFYVSRTFPGQEFVPNTALPTGRVENGIGIWSFYTQPIGGGRSVQREVLDTTVRGAYRQSAANEALEESPTRSEWEVVVTNPPPANRGAILNMVPPGDGYAAGNLIVLGGFYDDEEARHVATSVARKYGPRGAGVTYGPKKKIEAAEEKAVEKPCGCHAKEEASKEAPRENPIADERAPKVDVDNSPCRPFTRITRETGRFEVCMLRAKEIGEINNSAAIYRLIAADIQKNDEEHFYVICTDFRGQLRDYVELSIGQRHRVAVDIEDILAAVLLSKCDGFAIVHCHPSGHAEPSPADRKLTKMVRDAAKVACPNVPLVDHLVVGLNQYYSFTDKKIFKR